MQPYFSSYTHIPLFTYFTCNTDLPPETADSGMTEQNQQEKDLQQDFIKRRYLMCRQHIANIMGPMTSAAQDDNHPTKNKPLDINEQISGHHNLVVTKTAAEKIIHQAKPFARILSACEKAGYTLSLATKKTHISYHAKIDENGQVSLEIDQLLYYHVSVRNKVVGQLMLTVQGHANIAPNETHKTTPLKAAKNEEANSMRCTAAISSSNHTHFKILNKALMTAPTSTRFITQPSLELSEEPSESATECTVITPVFDPLSTQLLSYRAAMLDYLALHKITFHNENTSDPNELSRKLLSVPCNKHQDNIRDAVALIYAVNTALECNQAPIKNLVIEHLYSMERQLKNRLFFKVHNSRLFMKLCTVHAQHRYKYTEYTYAKGAAAQKLRKINAIIQGERFTNKTHWQQFIQDYVHTDSSVDRRRTALYAYQQAALSYLNKQGIDISMPFNMGTQIVMPQDITSKKKASINAMLSVLIIAHAGIHATHRGDAPAAFYTIAQYAQKENALKKIKATHQSYGTNNLNIPHQFSDEIFSTIERQINNLVPNTAIWQVIKARHARQAQNPNRLLSEPRSQPFTTIAAPARAPC